MMLSWSVLKMRQLKCSFIFPSSRMDTAKQKQNQPILTRLIAKRILTQLIMRARFIYQNYMFCILPCAAVKDKVSLSPVGSAASLAPQMDPHRSEIRKLTDIDYLLGRLQQGEVIMTRKVAFDNYLASHVDLMRGYVSTFTPCNFRYASYFGGVEIDATGLAPRDQWALEIVMTRLNLSSIYQAGAYNSMRTIFTETASSYRENAKSPPELVKTIQMTYQYFNEGYQPLKRLVPYFDAVESLASASTKSKYMELNRGLFQVYTLMVSCNLAYLKIEKLRLLREFKKCKEASWAVFLRLKDCRARLSALGVTGSSITQMSQFFELGETFYQVLSLYFMVLQHDLAKNQEDYGFVKKQFQQMIWDNIVACDEVQRLANAASSKFRQENDNVLFGMGVMKVISQEVRKFKYRYTINVHENKGEKPTLQNIIGRRMGASNIWESLDFF